MQLEQADRIESYITDLRALAFEMLENGTRCQATRLVAKQSRRQWVDKAKIEAWADANGIEDATSLDN
jgi:hypothetical protein